MQETPVLSVLDRILEPVTRSLSPEVARSILRIRADAKARARVAELAEKCNQGTLSEEERAAYEMYIWAGKVVALLRAKARIYLAQEANHAHS